LKKNKYLIKYIKKIFSDKHIKKVENADTKNTKDIAQAIIEYSPELAEDLAFYLDMELTLKDKKIW